MCYKVKFGEVIHVMKIPHLSNNSPATKKIKCDDVVNVTQALHTYYKRYTMASTSISIQKSNLKFFYLLI